MNDRVSLARPRAMTIWVGLFARSRVTVCETSVVVPLVVAISLSCPTRSQVWDSMAAFGRVELSSCPAASQA